MTRPLALLLMAPLMAVIYAAALGWGEVYPFTWWVCFAIAFAGFLKGLDLMRGE